MNEDINRKVTSDKKDIIDAATHIKDCLETDDGKTLEEKKQEILAYYHDHEFVRLAEIMADSAIASSVGRFTRERFWPESGVVEAGENLMLRRVSEEDRVHYIALQQELKQIPFILNNEEGYELLWRDQTQGKSLMCVIERDGKFVGHCGIINILKREKEVFIEIFRKWRNRGIGTSAICCLLNQAAECFGGSEFCVRIAPENTASRKLFEKIGAVPDGLAEILLHSKEDHEQCERENQVLLDENLTELARQFGVEPIKLLSHLLRYKLVWKGRK